MQQPPQTIPRAVTAVQRLLTVIIAVIISVFAGTTSAAATNTAPAAEKRVGVATALGPVFVGSRTPGNPVSVGKNLCAYDRTMVGSCVATNTIGEVNTGVNKIYTSVDPVTGEIQYVGRTNDLARRAGEHLRSKGIQIDAVKGLDNLSLADAKAVEQVLIEVNGGPGGGQLLNKINSIAKSNPDYGAAIKRGCAILSTVGKSSMGAGVC